MLQATYACVSKGKEEIHCGALAGMNSQIHVLTLFLEIGKRCLKEWGGRENSQVKLMTAEMFPQIIQI